MTRVRAQILLNDAGQGHGSTGQSPLRFAYVRHEPFGATYITDVNGVIRDANGNEGIESLTQGADLTIYCQNAIARVLDGNNILQLCPTVAAHIDQPSSGGRDTVVVGNPNAGSYIKHFRILNQVADAYHTVWRQFEPFNAAGDFPLGRVADLESTRNQEKRIEVLFPSPASALPGLATALGINLPSNASRILSYTDPVGTSAGWPRINIEPDPPESRLFSGAGAFANGTRSGLTVIPSELAHALHFSLLTRAKRDQVRNDYLSFIIVQLANGLATTHSVGAPTAPVVAFIEAIDHFSHRFSEHVRSFDDAFPTGGISDRTQRNFAWNEMRGRNPVGPRVALRRIRQEMDPKIFAVPDPALGLSGSIDEGAVFGGIFIDLAFRVGLVEAVEALLASKKLTYGEFRTWVGNNRPALAASLSVVTQNWGL